jgi:putative membrane protein
MMYGYGADGMMGGGFGLVGGIFMLVFWILVIVGVVLLIKWLVEQTSHGGYTHAPPNSQALEIAKSRYAKGEISKEEFDQIKQDLM